MSAEKDARVVVAKLRVQRAMEDVEAAQRLLSGAAQALSPIIGGAPMQAKVMREYDRVHKLWYQVRGLLEKRIDLDHEPNGNDDLYMPAGTVQP